MARVKKSDLNKAWRKPRKGPTYRIAPEHHLIVSEGAKTEPNYFKGLAAAVNDSSGRNRVTGYRERIHFEFGEGGRNTLGVLEEAAEIQAKFRSEGVTFSHVWVVFDKDDFPDRNFNKACIDCERYCTDETQYHALWSNQCIELWFLLHFEYLNSDLSRRDYIDKLNSHFAANNVGFKYEKNIEGLFDILRPRVSDAVRNARNLCSCYDAKTTPSKMAPATKVFEIFDVLEPYLE